MRSSLLYVLIYLDVPPTLFLFLFLILSSVVDRHRVDGDPDPTFHFDADPDPDPIPSWKVLKLSFTAVTVYIVLSFLQ